MSSAAPHVKLLRQLSDARDDYRSGALDVDWDGGHATLFMVFGQPSHAVFEEKGKGRVEGNAALAALLRDLPPRFSVEPWRRIMTPSETLRCTVDDLVHHFAELAAAHAPSEPEDVRAPALRASAGDDSPDLAYDLTTFPLLPDGETLGPEMPADAVRTTDLAERLRSGLLTLVGPRLRAAATVQDGEVVDAVWVDATSHATGETAAMAIVGAREGTLTAYRFPAELAGAVAMLWRLPVEQKGMNLRWLDPDALVRTFTRPGEDRVVLVDAPQRGVALILNGRLVGVYSSEQRRPETDPHLLRALLAQSEGRVTVLRRASKTSAPPQPFRPPVDASHAFGATEELVFATEPAAAVPAGAVAAEETQAPPEESPTQLSDLSPWEPESEPVSAPLPAPVASNLDTFHLVDPGALAGTALAASPPTPVEASSDEVVAALSAEAVAALSEEPAAVDWYSAPPEPDTAGDLGIDFGEVRRELAQITEAWLGERDSAKAKALIAQTRSSVDDFVTTIDTIRGLEIPGCEPSLIHAMAKELQSRAAERLCAA